MSHQQNGKGNKRSSLVLIAMIVVCGLLLVYAFVQKAEADHQRENAEMIRMLAEKLEKKAKDLEKYAIEREELAEEMIKKVEEQYGVILILRDSIKSLKRK